jgi:photosystem II stability/assembly factor-like uncharacterized protein
MEKHRSALLAVLFLVVCWYLFGCGSVNDLSPSHGGGTRPARGLSPMLRKFTVTADTRGGDLVIRPAEEGEASTQARQLGAADGITLSGSATYAAGVLSGNVTVTSRHPQPLYDVRVVVGSISNSGVSVKNPAGTTPLLGSIRPYWGYGILRPGQTSLPQSWQFNVPAGTSFTFTVYLYANVWSYSPSDGGALNDVCFVDASRGWAVGDAGKLLVTRDGGTTWEPQSSPTREDLRGVFFLDENRGWAVGGAETVIATENGGRQWRVQVTSPGSSLALNAIAMGPNGFGWAGGTGGLLLSTENAGGMWLIEDAGTTGEIHGIFMHDPSTCWMVGNGVFRRTVDGYEWTAMSRPSGVSADLRDIWFISATQGFAAGANGTLLKTINGGTNWSKVSLTATTAVLNAIEFATPQTGWIVGAGGTIRVTRNGGLQWSAVTNPATGDLLGLSCVSGNDRLAAAVGAAGVTLRTTDGQTWQAGGTGGSAATWRAIDWFNADHGWVVGSGGEVRLTTNGGYSWSKGTSGLTTELYDVEFQSPSIGWACGASGKLLKTTNGGASWSLVSTPAASTTLLYAVRFLDAQRGWLVGSKGTILRTTNGGSTWTAVPSPATNAVYWAMDWSADGRLGWVVGQSGVIIRTADGGTTWTKISSGITSLLYAVRMRGGLGLAVGAGGAIMRTTDGGLTWTKRTSGITTDLRAVDFTGPASVWAAGVGGRALRSNDGGATWSAVETGTTRDLLDLCAIDADNLWVAGATGTIKQMN